MTQFANIPTDIHRHIADFLRPRKCTEDRVADEVKVDPFSKAKDVATIKCIHRNFQDVLLWKNHAWKERIRQWCDEHLTKMRWVYKYGTLPEKMIQKDWESKINHIYRHQGCYVETMIGTSVGTGFSEEGCEYKVILFEVSLRDLITGIRPLPHCFGHDRDAGERARNSALLLTRHFVPAPSLNTMIPKYDRRKWLLQCFTECILNHWGEKIVEKNGGSGEKLDFMKEFKKIMELPSDYELTQGQLFRMFLKELQVRSDYSDPDRRDAGDGIGSHGKLTENIDQLCRQNFPYVRLDYMAEKMRRRKSNLKATREAMKEAERLGLWPN